MGDDGESGPASRCPPACPGRGLDLAELAPELAEAAGRSLPVFGAIGGLSVVVISAADYHDLVVAAARNACAALSADPPAEPKRTRRGRQSRRVHRLTLLQKNPDVRQFILDRIGTQDGVSIRLEAVARFGAGRVPSRSALNRYVNKVRASTERTRQQLETGGV